MDLAELRGFPGPKWLWHVLLQGDRGVGVGLGLFRGQVGAEVCLHVKKPGKGPKKNPQSAELSLFAGPYSQRGSHWNRKIMALCSRLSLTAPLPFPPTEWGLGS